MMNVLKSMEQISSGKFLLSSSNACLLLLKLRIKFSVSMEDCRLKLILSIKLETLIDNKISHIMEHFAIFCGQILQMMAKTDSTLRQEEQDTAGAKISVTNLCIETT